MRKRTNMSGLISHTTPNGKSYSSSESRCRVGIQKLQRLVDEGFKITGTELKKIGNPKEVIVSVFGGKLKMTFTEYQQRGQGLKVLMEIF